MVQNNKQLDVPKAKAKNTTAPVQNPKAEDAKKLKEEKHEPDQPQKDLPPPPPQPAKPNGTD